MQGLAISSLKPTPVLNGIATWFDRLTMSGYAPRNDRRHGLEFHNFHVLRRVRVITHPLKTSKGALVLGALFLVAFLLAQK